MTSETTTTTTTTNNNSNESTDPRTEESLKVLRYLSLPEDYTPHPTTEPLAFLKLHLSILPSSLLQQTFTSILSPLERTKLVAIRNRRLQYHSSSPSQFSFPVARNRWVRVWDEIAPTGAVLREDWRANARADREEEEQWAEGGFLKEKELLGERRRLGRLLGDYEEERAGEVQRAQRSERLRGYRQEEEVLRREKEEESSEEEEEMREEDVIDGPMYPTPASQYLEEGRESGENEKLRRIFERTLKERYIDGRLEEFEYDAVDWDDKWDLHSTDDEERWFDEEEEADADPIVDGTGSLDGAPSRTSAQDSSYDY
ncbi:hypothetical protein FRC19_002809 [Serendipita sp. 401]|nr:hypothetical protein FRC15_004388 [Serendipita sp. 397]KAG8812908.1 hypothetical protein FRC19_002809 [Serendipita sp. 401]